MINADNPRQIIRISMKFQEQSMAMMIEERKLDNGIEAELSSLMKRFAGLEKKLRKDQ